MVVLISSKELLVIFMVCMLFELKSLLSIGFDLLVMITRLNKIDSFMPNNINQPMFLGNSTGPNS